MIVEDYDKLNLKKFKMKSLMPDSTVLLLGRRRSGKCLMKGEKVLMYDGTIRKVEDIQLGDLVMGDDSTPRTVLETHSGKDILYKITHNDSQSYIVNSHHILSLMFSNENKQIKHNSYKKRYRVNWFDKNTYTVVQTSFSYKYKNKDQVYNKVRQFLIEKNGDYKVDIPIRDYLKLTCSQKTSLLGYNAVVEFQETSFSQSPYTFGYNLGQLEYPSQTGIPNEYKINSKQVRLEFLAGLIDACGILINNKFELDLENELVSDFIYIAKSLGFDAKYTNGKIVLSGNALYTIPTLNPTKRSVNQNTDIISTVNTSPITVEEIGEGDYSGIELDGNHRFILGNFIVTHNSFLVRDIFYHHRNIPKGVIFSGTEEASPFFADFIPDVFIHSEYDPRLIESILVSQKKKIREAKTAGKSESGKAPENNMFIVLDDLLHDAQQWKREKTIKNIFFNGRHYNLLFILTMQYPLGITPELRSNIDYVFIFNEPSVKNRKKIYEDYCSIIPTFDHFCNILDSCTQNHECLVVKTSGKSNKLHDQLFWYKADSHTNFQAGHKKFWKFHNKNFNDKYEEENDKMDQNVQEIKQKYGKTKKLKVFVNRDGDIVGHNTTDS